MALDTASKGGSSNEVVAMDELLSELRALLGPGRVASDRASLAAYEYDASLARSRPQVVVFPETTLEVSEVVKLAAARGVPVLARGAGTGLSGGAVPVSGGAVMCFARMSRIIEIDARNRTALVEPGVVNADLSHDAERLGLYYAPDPSSERTCTLGGNVAENSGGAHCLAHGTTTNYVLGVEVVTADGSVCWLGGAHGDAAGYDLTGVFVGSEGTFGIVTKILLRLRHRPEAVETLLAAFPDVRSAGDAVSRVIAAGSVPVALELMDGTTVRAVEAAVKPGFPTDAGAVLLVEVEGVKDGLDDEIRSIHEILVRAGASSARLAEGAEDRARLWAGRKKARSVLGTLAPNYYVHDGVVPRTQIANALDAAVDAGKKHGLTVATYLHAGDGNIHPNVLFDASNSTEAEHAALAGKEILRACVDLGGALSGEHGIGVEKQEFIEWTYSDADQSAMRRVKSAFDPKGLLNPGKVLPAAN